MLADTIEAAVRSMPDPTPQAIQRFIERLVRGKIEDGQLSGSPLSLLDIDGICEAFSSVLSGVFHERIEYPTVQIPSDGKAAPAAKPAAAKPAAQASAPATTGKTVPQTTAPTPAVKPVPQTTAPSPVVKPSAPVQQTTQPVPAIPAETPKPANAEKSDASAAADAEGKEAEHSVPAAKEEQQ